jgi:hypothetical protein
MNQQQLGLRLHLPAREVSRIETGKRDLERREVMVIAVVLKVKTDWLLMLSEEGGPNRPDVVLRKEKSVKLAKWHKTKDAWVKSKQKEELLRKLRRRPPPA